MARRNIKIDLRLNEQEMEWLRRDVIRSGWSREKYLRALIEHSVIKEIPVAPRLFPRQKQSEVHTMHDRKSLYSRNKRNSRAILCPDAFEQDHPLTPEQFSSEEEFRFWKMWSDENYHVWELADHIYSDHTSPLTEYSAAEPSPEDMILSRLDRRESVMFAQSSLQKIRGIVTEKQYRRIQMYCEGMTYREIAEAEGVSAKNVFKSVMAGKKKISKILEKGGNK